MQRRTNFEKVTNIFKLERFFNFQQGYGVGCKISDSDIYKISDSNSRLRRSKISDSDLSKISDSDSLTLRELNLTVKINGDGGAQQEISISTKVSIEIVQFQQEFPI